MHEACDRFDSPLYPALLIHLLWCTAAADGSADMRAAR